MANSPVKKISRSQRLLLTALWPLVWLWTRSLRYEISPEALALAADTSRPTVGLFWHNRVFVCAEFYRRYRLPHPTHALISASQDGGVLAACAERFGIHAVRGSSSRGGREALYALAACLGEGCDVMITPDGPRGPVYSFQPGAAMLVRRCRARVLLIGTDASFGWRMRSWDRFILPRPFSKIRVVARVIEAEQLPGDLKEAIEFLRSALAEINAE